MERCQSCHNSSQELRRGRCLVCYDSWVKSRPVGWGASCKFCAEKRRNLLRSTEMLGRWTVLCFTCKGQIDTLDSVPQSFGEIREELRRDRRLFERREGKKDDRVYARDRRKDQRRKGRASIIAIEDSMILDENDFDLPIDLSGVPTGEPTQIIEIKELESAELSQELFGHFSKLR